jgi:tricorn protease
MVVDQVSRWDVEWRGYRGGQNTPWSSWTWTTLDEVLLPNDRTTDIHPVWMDDGIFFLSDRDWVSNVWSYHVATGPWSRSPISPTWT